ncbi:hypothetical protein GCM10018954_036160 [Kutzneria kofuensis]
MPVWLPQTVSTGRHRRLGVGAEYLSQCGVPLNLRPRLAQRVRRDTGQHRQPPLRQAVPCGALNQCVDPDRPRR